MSRDEARAAFVLLNKIRTNPKAYRNSFQQFGDVKPKPALRWNDTLARVAEAKALDMATRNYFAHVDPDGYGINYYIHKAGYALQPAWLKDRKFNYFESCNAGGLTGEEAIKMLIVDDGVPDLGHRKHLLGMDSWSHNLVDVGIGYARSNGKAVYKTYTCVIIAKHQ